MRNRFTNSSSQVLIGILTLLSACDTPTAALFGSANGADPTADPNKNFKGCVSATAPNVGVVNLKVSVPDSTTQVIITRNEKVLATLNNVNLKNFTYSDTTVDLGVNYTYKCSALIYNATVTGNTTQTIKSLTVAPFVGITSTTGLGTTKIQVGLQFPPAATAFTLYRNSNVIKTFPSPFPATNYSYVDASSDIIEGKPYEYTCASQFGPNISQLCTADIATASTQIQHPPTFTGLATATITDGHSISLEWLPASNTNVPVTKYQVFSKMGTTLNWNAKPTIELAPDQTSYSLTNLGTELNYTFGVRACSTATICDSNTLTQTLQLPPDTTYQITTQASGTGTDVSVAFINGAVHLYAPWNPINGSVALRTYYIRPQTNGQPLNLATPTAGDTNASLSASVVLSDTSPPVDIIIPTSILADNTPYSFYVLDQDSGASGTTLSNKSYAKWVTFTTGSIQPPTYAGITNSNLQLVAGSQDSQIKVTYPLIQNITPDTPTARPSGNPNRFGIDHYNIYSTSAPVTAASPSPFLSLGDPCANTGTLVRTKSALTCNATAGICASPTPLDQTNFSGLNPRTAYGFCVKAVDLYGIESNTSGSGKIVTGDITPPAFAGISGFTYNSGNNSFNFTWTPSPSSDMDHYIVSLYKQGQTLASASMFYFGSGTYSTGASIPLTSLSYVAGDIITAEVDACDNAAELFFPTSNTTPLFIQPGHFADNCTSISSVLYATLPDVVPPTNFGGIVSATNSPIPSGLQEGYVNVNWNTPTGGWAHYGGFNIYNFNAANTPSGATLLGSCGCIGTGSAISCPTSCTLKTATSNAQTVALEAGKTYNL